MGSVVKKWGESIQVGINSFIRYFELELNLVALIVFKLLVTP